MKRTDLPNLTDEEFRDFRRWKNVAKSLRPSRKCARMLPTRLDLYREVDRLRGEVQELREPITALLNLMDLEENADE